MAAGTGGLCRSERRAGVARLTTYADMCTVQNETGTEVIKRVVNGSGIHWQQAAKQDHCNYSFHCSDLTSWNELSLWQRAQSGPNSPS